LEASSVFSRSKTASVRSGESTARRPRSLRVRPPFGPGLVRTRAWWTIDGRWTSAM
jgi:hypothetical protein